MLCSSVVFQHGLCADRNQPPEVFPEDAGFELITMECRGHGSAPAGDSAQLSIATFTSDLAALIEARELAPVVVGGISMGAAIALRLAVHRPELVRALILARPAWIAESSPENLAPMRLVGRLLSEFPPEKARVTFERTETAARLQREAPDNLATLRGFFSREPLAVTAALLTRIASDGPGVALDAIAGLSVPALVIGTDRDAIHPFTCAETLAGLIRGAELVKITPKADSFERYQWDFREALGRFLRPLSGAAR